MEFHSTKAIPEFTGAAGSILHRARSHWFDSAAAYAPSGPLCGDLRVDCCVIGGGITGVSTAYHLKKLDPSLSVALLEAEVIGYGASGRNAGQLIIQFGQGDLSGLIRRYGAQNIGVAWDYVHQGLRLIESLPAQEGIEFDYAPTGYMGAGLRIDGEAQLAKHHKLLERIGQASNFTHLDTRQVESEFASPYLGAALYDPRGGQFNPLKLVRGFKRAAERRGVTVFEHSPVAYVQVEPSHLIVHCGAGSIRCEKLVLATNAYTHQIEGLRGIGMGREQTPLMVKASVSEPLSTERWAALAWPRRCGVNVMSEMFYSFAPTSDGRLVYVSGHFTTAPRARETSEIEWRLKRQGPEHLAAFFPALDGVRIAQTWGGPISITADSIPHLGRSHDSRIVYACGCWGHGMAIGTQNGRTLAELTLEQRTAHTDLWFVQRRKVAWPSQTLAGFIANRVISLRRRGNRRIGAAMQPPLRFES